MQAWRNLINKRITIIYFLFCLAYLALGARFFYYQVAAAPCMAKQAALEHRRAVILPGEARGDILDRNYRTLTGQGRGWVCLANPGQVLRSGTTVSKLASMLGQGSLSLRRKLLRSMEVNQPLVFLGYLPASAGAKAAAINRIEGAEAAPVVRRYREDGFLVHTIGYAVPVRGKTESGYGLTGLERIYDAWLKEGWKEYIDVVDGRGQPVAGLSHRIVGLPSHRETVLVTTLDSRVQEIVEEVMNRRVKSGAVVVLDVRSRDIIAMASRPAFNPYAVDISIAKGQEQGALINRALWGFYPGSLFKILTAVAGLEEGIIKPDEKIFCDGVYILPGGSRFHCWKKDGHGQVDLKQALAYSCNEYFLNMSFRMGQKAMARYAEQTHLFEQDIIGYPGAQTSSTLRIGTGEADLANATLGQKGVKMTPLQAANMMATIAADGVYRKPRLVREIRQGEKMLEYFPQGRPEQVISRHTCWIIKNCLKAVTAEGTGTRAWIENGGSAGKTATSQTGRVDAAGREVLDVWFAGYFPVEKPQWAVAVLVENGRSGGDDAAPVFREIAEKMAKLLPQ